MLDDDRLLGVADDLELLDLLLVQLMQLQKQRRVRVRVVDLEPFGLGVELVGDVVAAFLGEVFLVATVDAFGGVVVEAELFVPVTPPIDRLPRNACGL